MRYLRYLLITTIVGLAVFSPLIGSDGESREASVTLLHLSSIGFPTAQYPRAAWKINDLKIFNGRLYVGCGDAVINTGPTDIIYFDFKDSRFFAEFTVDDEAIYRYQVVDGKLVIPGPDATEDWAWGNIYVLTEDGWKKKRTVPHGIHVNQVVSFKNRWYAATGSYFEFGDDELYAFGGILSSEDEGDTWKLVYASPSDDRSVFRIGSIIAFKDKLYAFPYSYRGMGKGEIPEEYHRYLSDRYGDGYLILEDDPLGPSDVLSFDGNEWSYLDFIPSPHICIVSPFVFKDRLLLSLVSGIYVDYLALGKNMPPNANSSLCAFDGEGFTKLDFDYDLIRDVVVSDGNLLLLILKDGEYRIAMTNDLVQWEYYVFPPSLNPPRSIEFDNGIFYIGTDGGNIFRSIGTTKLPDTATVADRIVKFHGAAELPRDGMWYWAAIREWERWGKLAQFSCGISKGNTIDVTTENVSGLSVFVPLSEIDSSKTVEVRVNRNTVFKDKLQSATELVLTKQEGIMWNVAKGNHTRETFQYSKRLMGSSDIALSGEGLDSPLGSFIADVLSWAVSADAAIIPRSGLLKGIPAGEVFLEELFDAFHRDTIFTFKVKGADLYRMMEFNISREERRRCQIAGFTFTHRVVGVNGENSIVTSSIDPAKTYLVATTSFLARRMEEFLGEDTNCTDSGISVQDGLMGWFEEFNHVSTIEPRILEME